jgi:hypothetical protein
MLLTARFLRLFLPGVLRWGMQKADPVPAELIERARQRAAAGKKLGETD